MNAEVPLWALGVGAIITSALGAFMPTALRAFRLWLRERRVDRSEDRDVEQAAASTIFTLLRESRAEVRELGNRLQHATEVAVSLRAENGGLKAEVGRLKAELADVRGYAKGLEDALQVKDAVIGEMRKATVAELIEAVQRESKE